MPEHEKIKNEKPKYEKPIVIDLAEPLMGEGAPDSCTSGPIIHS